MNPLFKLFIAAHIRLYRATGGRIGSSMMGARVLLLTTTGNKSGQPRTVPLMTFSDGDQDYIVASNNGAPGDPAWYKNLKTRPEVTVQLGARIFGATAVTAPDEERDRVYRGIAAKMKNFAAYEKKAAPRKIPIVRLVPISG